MQIKEYTDAAYEVIKEKGVDVALANLKSLLERRGLMQFYPRILRGLVNRFEKEERKTPKVIFAREKDKATFEKEVSKLLKEHLGVLDYETRIDPQIIGGFVIEGTDVRIDQSFKKELLNAYQRLTANS